MGLKAKNCPVIEENSEQTVEADGSQESQPELSAGYDSYRSLADSNLIIFVPKHAVPPFRFKAGGWELLQASIDLNPEAKARVAEKGYFIEGANSASSGEVIPSSSDDPAPHSLEIEFALVIADSILPAMTSANSISRECGAGSPRLLGTTSPELAEFAASMK